MERAATVAGEAVVGIGVAVVCVLLARGVVVDPLDRVGQVSGLASLGLHHVVLGLVVLAAVGVAARFAPVPGGRVAAALGCAAAAGLVTGLVAGGLVLALRGTTSPLFANGGDAGRLANWARDVLAGGAPPADYPPLTVQGIAWWVDASGWPPGRAFKLLQVGGAAVFGPVAYLAWRPVLRPLPALVMALVAAVPTMDLYKPYANLVLVVLLPVLVRLLQSVRESAGRAWWKTVAAGVGFGLVLGVLFVTYSGWFVWSAVGAVVVTLVVLPWRAGPGRAAALLVATAAGFLLVAARHLFGLLGAAGTTSDTFQYFDTATEPAYIAMWRNDTPGPVGPWPPPGELGGVGLFSALLVLGLGAAIALGHRRTDVRLLAACLAGAWLVRFLIASRMYATGTVQLWPRTTVEILYCLLALCVLAAMLGLGRARELYRRWRAETDGRSVLPARRPSTVVAVLAAALLAGLFMGSATADRYQPRPDGSAGYLAYVSQQVRGPDGVCPAYGRPGWCYANAALADLANKGQPPPSR